MQVQDPQDATCPLRASGKNRLLDRVHGRLSENLLQLSLLDEAFQAEITTFSRPAEDCFHRSDLNPSPSGLRLVRIIRVGAVEGLFVAETPRLVRDHLQEVHELPLLTPDRSRRAALDRPHSSECVHRLAVLHDLQRIPFGYGGEDLLGHFIPRSFRSRRPIGSESWQSGQRVQTLGPGVEADAVLGKAGSEHSLRRQVDHSLRFLRVLLRQS